MQASLGREYYSKLGSSPQPTTFPEAEGISPLVVKGNLSGTAPHPDSSLHQDWPTKLCSFLNVLGFPPLAMANVSVKEVYEGFGSSCVTYVCFF